MEDGIFYITSNILWNKAQCHHKDIGMRLFNLLQDRREKFNLMITPPKPYNQVDFYYYRRRGFWRHGMVDKIPRH